MRRLLAVVVAATSVVALSAGTARATAGDVHIVGGAPNPASLTVNDGDSVTIFNDDDVAHAIFAKGVQQGPSIAPHTSGEYGPFDTGGKAGRFDYRVDSDGGAGVILVRATQATTSTTRAPTTTTVARTTTSTTVATTTTSTTIATTTTTSAVATSTTVMIIVGEDTTKKMKSNRLAVIGFMLLLVGLGGFVILTTTARRRRERQQD